MKDLCGCLVPLLKSPLGAPEVSKVFLELGQAVFDDSTLGRFNGILLTILFLCEFFLKRLVTTHQNYFAK